MTVYPEQPKTNRELALDTAAGNHIDNEQIHEIAPTELNQYKALREKYQYDEGISIFYRTSASPKYNCHGLTFASRRTGVFSAPVVRQILEDDNYRQVGTVGQYTDVMPGDVILYVAEDGDIEHSGVVLSSPANSSLGVPMVWSKWGRYAEVIHPANRCPYDFSMAEYYRVFQ